MRLAFLLLTTVSVILLLSAAHGQDLEPEMFPEAKEEAAQAAVLPPNREFMKDIDRVHNISYTDFVLNYMVPRKPVVLQGLMKGWPALEQWTPEYFAKRWPRTKCDAQIGNRVTRTQMSISRFVSYMRKNEDKVPMYCEWDTAQLSDEDVSDLMRMVEIPDMFANDWFVGCTAQYTRMPNTKITPRALYFGGKNSGIVNHQDNLNTWVFSYQIAGRKRWKLYSAANHPFVYDGAVDMFRTPDDHPDFPLLKYARGYDFTTTAGDILFWPVGEYHTTLVEENSIGFSENLVNYFNYNEFIHSFHRMCEESPNIQQCQYVEKCQPFWNRLFGKGPRMTPCARRSKHHYCRTLRGFDKPN